MKEYTKAIHIPGEVITVSAREAKTLTFTTDDVDVGNFRELLLFVFVSAASGTTPTLNIDVQVKNITEAEYKTIYSFTEITAAGHFIRSIGAGLATAESFGTKIRCVCTIGGTTPSFTFGIEAIGK